MRLSDVSRRRAGKTSAVRARRTVRVCVCSTRGGGGGGSSKSGGGGGGGVLCRRRGATEEIRGQDVLESRTYRRPCRWRVPAATIRPFLRRAAMGVGFSLLGSSAPRRARRFPYVRISAPASAPSALFSPLAPQAAHRRPRADPSAEDARVFFLRSSLVLIFFPFHPFFPNRLFSLPRRRTPSRAAVSFVSFHTGFVPVSTHGGAPIPPAAHKRKVSGTNFVEYFCAFETRAAKVRYSRGQHTTIILA